MVLYNNETGKYCSNKYYPPGIYFLIFILLPLLFVQKVDSQETISCCSDYIIPHQPEERTSRSYSLSNEKKVRIVYLVPLDSLEKQEYTLSLENAARHLQLWYRKQLGENRTFRLSDPVVDVYKTPHIAQWYSTNPNGTLFSQFWNNVLKDGFELTRGSFYDPNNIWIFYIDALNACGQCGGCGGGGVAVISANDLRGLIGLPWIPICPGEGRPYTPCRYIGGLGHELGHAFGVPHPPGCEPYTSECDDNSIMWTGYTLYPDCYFSESEKNILRASSFIQPLDVCECEFSCTDLLIQYYYKTSLTMYFCPGDSTLVAGVYRKEPGIYYDSSLTVGGCDSVIETQLIRATRVRNRSDIVLCEGEEYLLDGEYYDKPGSFIDSFKTVHGCDSIRIVNVFVYPSYSSSIYYDICDGDTLYLDNRMYFDPGVYYDSLTTIKGCDSILTTEVSVHPHYQTVLHHEICEGDSVFLADDYRKLPGIYPDSLKSSTGCDSIIINHLTVHPVFESHLVYEICEGESIILGGEKRYKAGIYHDTVKTSHGCNLVILSDLIVHDLPDIYLGKDTVITTSDTLLLTAGPGFLEYGWNTGSSEESIRIYDLYPGDHQFSVIVQDSNYCTNMDTISIQVFETNGISDSKPNRIKIYPNPATNCFVIKLPESTDNDSALRLKLYDTFGRKTLEKSIHSNDKKGEIIFDISNQNEGVFFLIIEFEDSTITKKIIKYSQ